MKNYYKILGVMDDAEDIVIRAAYKALAQRYHPDKWQGDEDSANRKMSDINEAYGVLSDKAKRATYDQEYHSNR
jgi:DnaJ-class molecular chaperone